MCSDAAELLTAGSGGCWMGKTEQVQERQIHQDTETLLGSGSA